MSSNVIVPIQQVTDATMVFVVLKSVSKLRSEQQELINISPASSDARRAKLAAFEQEVTQANLADSDMVLQTPIEFQTRHSGMHLPKGALVVGWLDADGYRQIAGVPCPDAQWLENAADQLAQWCEAVRLPA